MSYLFKRKFSILELANVPRPEKKVLIAEPEEYLRQLYTLGLAAENFLVFHSQSPKELEEEVEGWGAHLLVINTEFLRPHGDFVHRLKKIKSKFPALHVVTLSLNTPGEHLKEFMQAGISSHIERKLTRPSDVVTIIKSLLNH